MTDSATYLSQLHQLLNQHFNLAEIRTLVLDLSIDYESVAGEEKPSRIRELLLELARNGRLPELVTLAQEQRPHVEWPTVPDDFELPKSLEMAASANKYYISGDVVYGDKVLGDKVMGDKHEHHHYPPEKDTPSPPRMALKPPDDFVQRPQEYEQLITHLLGEDKQTVAITATLQGAGGFGKTTLAQAICHDERILDAYPDGILWTTVGEDRTKIIPGLQKLYKALTGEEAQFIDEHDATVQLSAELDERRCLLVIDDVWNGGHLRPFLQGGKQCARLITTRITSVVPKEAKLVTLDAMRQSEAVDLLGTGLGVSAPCQLLALAGRLGEWPLLLKLVNGRLYEDIKRHGLSVSQAITAVNEELDEFGLISFDAANAEERYQAVAASMSVSLRQLQPDAMYGRTHVDEAARFHELAVFPEDAVIPVSVVGLLWGETDQLSIKATERLCRRLANLSLLLNYDQQTQTIQLHDVTRHYLIEHTANEQYQSWQEHLLNGYERKCGGEWQCLPDDGYTYHYLLWHMGEAGQQNKLEQVLFNFDWLDAKLQANNILNLINDFDLRQKTEGQSQLDLLRHALQLSAGVLAVDKNQLASQLYGRLSGLGKPWEPFVGATQQQKLSLRLQTQSPSLTPPGGSLIYTLIGHSEGVDNLLLIGDSCLITSCSGHESRDNTVRVWDINTGALLRSLTGHTAGVSNLLLIDDNHLLSSCGWGNDHTMKVWDIETGRLLHSLEGHTAGVDNMIITDTGRLISSCHATTLGDNTVKIWDIETGTMLFSLEGHPEGVDNMLLADHSYLLTSSCGTIASDHLVKVWDIETGMLLHRLKGHIAPVCNLLLTGDGRLLTSCRGKDHTVKVWDIETGTLLHSLEGHTSSISNLLLTSNGRLISSSGSSKSNDHTVKVWNIETGTLLHSLEGHTSPVTNLLLTSNGYLLSCSGGSKSNDHTVKVWNIETGTLLHTLNGHAVGVNNMLLIDDGHLVTSCGGHHSKDYTAKIWDINTGILLHTLRGHSAGIDKLVPIKENRLLSSCGTSNDSTVKVWNIETGALLGNLEGHVSGVDNLLLTDGGHLVSSCGGRHSNDHTVKVWDIKARSLLHSLEEHNSPVRKLLLTGDGRLISSCWGKDQVVKIWDIKTATLLQTLTDHTAGVENLLLTSNKYLFFSCSNNNDHAIKIRDIKTGTLLHSLEGHTALVSNLLLTNDERLLSCCGGRTSDDHTVKVWDTQTGLMLQNLDGHTAGVSNLLLTNNGSLISSASNQIKVWDIETGELLRTLEGHTARINNLLLTDNGCLISSADINIKVWHIETGVLLHNLEGHTDQIENLLLTGDGRLISSCGATDDRTIKVWNVETGTLLHSLEGHTHWVDNLLLTNDGRLSSSCRSDDHTVKVWDIEQGSLLRSLDGHISGVRFMMRFSRLDYLMTVEGPRLIIWQIDEGEQLASFTADGPIESYAITPDDRIVLGDGLGRVHFLKLV
ncbi:MAG: hypothetical protein H6657_25080 [Ardenticatenaceae bacterium]|nr:hypothetical protein [Ardenticatenaceae bacterium]